MFLSIASLCDAQNLMPQPNKKGLWGYVNEKGKYKIKPLYQAAEPFSEELACVKINDQYGYINPEGQFVISAVYDRAESFIGNLAKCSKDGKYGLIDRSGAEYLEFRYDALKLSKNKHFYEGQINGDDKAYIIALSPGEPAVNAFDEVSDIFSNGFAYVKSDGVYGYIDSDGKVVVRPTYLELPQFTTDRVAVSHTSGGYGLIDASLKNILPEQYAFVTRTDGGSYHYGNSPDAFGILSAEGAILVKEGAYRDIKAIDGALYQALDQQGKRCVFNEQGKILLADCDELTVAGNVATYKVKGNPGKMNLSDGRMAITVKGKEIWSPGKATKILFEQPFILWVDEQGNEHRMTESGKAVFEGYSKVQLLSKGYYAVEKDNRQAVADASGNILTDWVNGILPLLDDYVQLVKSYGYGNYTCAIFRTSTGKMITGYDFKWVDPPQNNGLIPVTLIRGDKLGRTQKQLKMAGDSFYIAGDLSEGFYAITDAKTKKMGVMKEDGKILVKPKYDEVDDFHCGMCRVWIAEKGNGFINTTGTLVVPCQYPQVLNFGDIEGIKSYTQVWDYWGQTYYIDKKGKVADPNKVIREGYNSQQQNSWY